MGKATQILRDKVILRSGVIVEIKVWQVLYDDRFPDGYKYSLFAVYDGEVLVGYDNHHPKGHHRHIGNNSESEYNFTTLEKLKNDFKSDLEVQLAKKGLL